MTGARAIGAKNPSGTSVSCTVLGETPVGSTGFQGLSPEANWAK
jgi:hypothetical protein